MTPNVKHLRNPISHFGKRNMQINSWADMTFPLCIHFMKLMQSTHKYHNISVCKGVGQPLIFYPRTLYVVEIVMPPTLSPYILSCYGYLSRLQ
jgi:hypothetical protein